MLRFLLFVQLLLQLNLANAQNTGLNKLMLLPDARSNHMISMLIQNDTIICAGNVINTKGQYGVFIAKFDTLGELLSHVFHFNKKGGILGSYNTSTLISTLDHGYLILAGNQAQPRR